MSDFSPVERSVIDNAKRQMTSLPDVMQYIPEDPDPDPYGYAQQVEEQTGLTLLPKTWKASPDDTLYNKRLLARGRRAQVQQLLLSGIPREEIARELGVAEVTIDRDIRAINEEWRDSYLASAEDIAAKNIARLESYLSALQGGISRGDTKAINTAVEIIKELNNVVGVRQGVQVDIEQYIREVAESNGFDPDAAVAIAQKITITMK